MTVNTDNEIKTFHRTLQGQHAEALEPDSPLYVPIWQTQPQKDPILQLAGRIRFAESESVNILTGFRGNGKSTELRRLRKQLENQDCSVILIDMLKYLHMTKPLEISDFLLSLVAALAAAVSEKFGVNTIDKNALKRFWQFLNATGIVLEGGNTAINAGLSSSIGFKLHRDPDFKAQVQKKMRGHLDGLVQEVEAFVRQLVKSLQRGNAEHKVVLLVDSVEQLPRGRQRCPSGLRQCGGDAFRASGPFAFTHAARGVYRATVCGCPKRPTSPPT